MKRLRAGALASLALASACGARETPAARPGPAAPPPPAEEPAAASWAPPHWDYHPSAPDTIRAHMKLADGSCIVVTEGGQRWATAPRRGASTDADPEPARCRGLARASSFLAPEDLIGVFRRSQSSWLFVGESGAVYEAGDALGPFARVAPPPEPLRKVAGAGAFLAGVTRAGKLLRWQGETGWSPASPVALPVFDVALDDAGKGLALAFPEALFTTEDGGATWTAPPAPAPSTVGADRVGVTATGALLAEGLLGSIVWDPRQKPSFSRVSETLPRAFELHLDAGRAPNALAVAAGRAQIDDDRYFEAIRPEADGAPWELARGRIEGRLESLVIPATEECGSIKLGARGKLVAIACVRAQDDVILAKIRRSDDDGSTWRDLAEVATPDTDLIGIAVAPDGSVLLSGVCKADPQAACQPGAPLLLRRDTGKTRVVVASTPGIGGPALAPAFSFDGRSAYLLARRVKDDQAALYVSHDGGETFAERALDRPPGAPRAYAEGDGDTPQEDPPLELELSDGASIQTAEDGAVGISLPSTTPPVHLVADDDGRVLSVAVPPAEYASLAGHARHVLAMAARDPSAGFGDSVSGEDDSNAVWESLDGGAVWTEVSGTRALGREYGRGSGALACGAGGCLLGETLSRVGWGGSPEPLRPSLAVTPIEPVREPGLRTPIVCELAATSRWTRIDRVYAAGDGVPDEDEAMRGRSVWSVLTYDETSGALVAEVATLPPAGDGPARVTARTLLGRVPGGARAATQIAPQMEGYAAARILVPKGELAGAPMPRVEVAWENWIEGTSGRRTLDPGGAFDPRDVEGATFATGLVSVSPGGVFVQPHAFAAQTFFLDLGKGVERFAYPAWSSASLGREAEVLGGGDAVLTGGRQLGVGFVEPTASSGSKVVLLARRTTGDAWDFTATSLAPEDGGETGELEWTYAGKELGVTSIAADPKQNRAWAFFSAFRGDGTFGPPVAVATELDLPDTPRACTDAERASSARIESRPFGGGSEPLYTGTRHPVVVVEAQAAKAGAAAAAHDPSVLLTSAAVLHGTPASPCVAAYNAVGIGGAALSAIVPGDPTHAWLFRPVVDDAKATKKKRGRSADHAIEYRPMSCRFDPAARVPDSVWREPGVFRIQR